MQKYTTYFLFFLLLCYTLSALGQQPGTKSKEVLLAELNTMKDDTNKVNAFVKSERIIGYDHHEFLETYLRIRDLVEQNSEPGKINISEKTKELLKDEFSLSYRGEIEAKNKGALKMYFVNS